MTDPIEDFLRVLRWMLYTMAAFVPLGMWKAFELIWGVFQ